MTPASVNDTNYLPYCTVYSRHTKQPIEKVFADKGYLPSEISLREPAEGRISPGEENLIVSSLLVIILPMESCEKIQPLPSSLNLKLNGIRKYPNLDIS